MRDRRDARCEPTASDRTRSSRSTMPVIAMLSRVLLLAVALAALALPRPAAAEALAPRACGDAPVADAPAKEGAAPSSTAEPGTGGPESVAIAGAAPGGAAAASDADGAAEACRTGASPSQASLAPDLRRAFAAPRPFAAGVSRPRNRDRPRHGRDARVERVHRCGALGADRTEDTIGRNLRSNWVLDDDAFWGSSRSGTSTRGSSHTARRRRQGSGSGRRRRTLSSRRGVGVVGRTTPSMTDPDGYVDRGVVLERRFTGSRGYPRGAAQPGRVVAATLPRPMEAVKLWRARGHPAAGPAPPSRAELFVGALTFDPDRGTPGRERVVPGIGAQ